MERICVEKVNATDVFKDDNNGFIFGLAEHHLGNYVEWFKTEEEREKCIVENNMIVV